MAESESVVLTSPTATALLAQALELSEHDRTDLAYQLLLSLEPREPENPELSWEASWNAEIDRRLQHYEEDKSTAIPGEEAIKQLREGLRKGQLS